MSDRHYYFWVATFGPDRTEMANPVALLEKAIAEAESEYGRRIVAGYELYCDVGTVEFELTGEPAPSWKYCAIAEISEDIDIGDLIEKAPAALTSGCRDGEAGWLTSEITTRPMGAGTCLPRPRPATPTMPAHFKVGIEYIRVRDEHWVDYQNFMRDVYGPIGKWLVEKGYCHKILITERAHSFTHEAAMPRWNCVHISSGDFDDERNGALSRVEEAVRTILGPDQTIASSFEHARDYRKKVMSKNVLVHSTWVNA